MYRPEFAAGFSCTVSHAAFAYDEPDTCFFYKIILQFLHSHRGGRTYCDYFNAIGKKCAENGILYGYHNHSHEFNKIEDKVIYDFMLENTDPKYVFFEMDVYWACMGRAYPVEYFRKYPGRFTMLHIKDHLELGESGMVGFDAIYNNADVAGMKDFIVELEGYTNGDWKESIKMCADYLLKSDFVKESYN